MKIYSPTSIDERCDKIEKSITNIYQEIENVKTTQKITQPNLSLIFFYRIVYKISILYAPEINFTLTLFEIIYILQPKSFY
jgi:hypothetical protein